ncbi:hydroxymethylglutaryl-CoA reductase, degradative [Agrococcus sp. Marseille-P2731]|uniref:hydroxymethylglutaryl-CoA reductase, degradative n=1 Tax=Agrococcus sp. Marseille-P2731 TaxID=1841862 RepID=UPI0009308525|nr:hydroxymethylglutaryl-CoA reductase, degradative [Agrococcus sp. Marseille-P2731]
MARTSRLSGLRNHTIEERRAIVADALGAPDALAQLVDGGLDEARADRMIEHVVGQIGIPLGVATNFLVNGREVLVPMATEEPSVVAAASNVARMARERGGFTTSSTAPIMQAQIHVVEVADAHGAKLRILEQRDELMRLADEQDPRLVELGGGVRDLIVRIVERGGRRHLVAHLLVDVRDAMGANAVNTMAEAIAPRVAELAGGRPLLRILTNKADLRLSRARVTVPAEMLGGAEVVENMILGAQLAEDDPYRAATHNKGIMNGITAVVLATGNDTRAVEAGAHSHAARDGHYGSLSHFERDAAGDLVATLELPLAVGLVGGATKSHPAAQAAVAMTEVTTAQELAELICAVGLSQNVAAVRALAAEGIQQGHMALHARNVAVAAGAEGDEIEAVAARLVEQRAVRADVAERELAAIRGKA